MSSIFKTIYFEFIKLLFLIGYKSNLKNKIDNSSYKWQNYIDDSKLKEIITLKINNNTNCEIQIGTINKDGKLISELPYFPCFNVLNDSMSEEKNTKVSLVIRNGILALKKDFGKNRKRFLNEYIINRYLTSKVSVPEILFLDHENNVIYKSVIKGRTIRDLLVNEGTKILIEQTENDPSLSSLENNEKMFRVWARGKKNILKCISQKSLDKIIAQTKVMHDNGVCKISLTYGNIIIDENEDPWFIDFENSLYAPGILYFFTKKYALIDFKMISNLYK